MTIDRISIGQVLGQGIREGGEFGRGIHRRVESNVVRKGSVGVLVWEVPEGWEESLFGFKDVVGCF